jgi:hypothetical protein
MAAISSARRRPGFSDDETRADQRGGKPAVVGHERLKLRRRIVESDQSAIKPTPIRCLGLERRILVVWTGVIPIWETALRPQHSGFCLGKRLCRTHQQYRDHSTYTTRQDTAWPDDAHRRAYTCGPRTDCIDAHARRAQTLLPAVQPPTQLAWCLCGSSAAETGGDGRSCHRSMRGQSRRPGRRWRQWRSRALSRRDAFPAAYRTCHISP